MNSLTGGCQCGAVRYEVTATLDEIYVCHCSECRRQSTSAYGISVTARSDDVRLVQGTVKRWSRLADSGNIVDCFFCLDCGSRIWHGDKEKHETISIKGGSLDEPVDITSAVHIWTASRLRGVIIPEHAQTFQQEPE